MKQFGIYTFAFKKDAPRSAIKAYTGDDYNRNDYMLGEVDLNSKAYEDLPLEIACKKRITQELKAKHGLSFYTIEDIIDFKCYRVWTNKISHVDTEIRNFILKYVKDTYIVDDTTEVVGNISRYWLDKSMLAYAKNDADIFRDKDFKLFSYQQDLENKALAWLKDHTRCLYHLSTRGGKSFLSLDTSLNDGAENILILTPFPAAQESFADIAKFHIKFSGWKFYTKEDITEDTVFAPTHNIILLSWQIFDKDLEKAKIRNILNQIKFTHSIIDETHNTSSSNRSQIIQKNLDDDDVLDLEVAESLAGITDEAVETMNNTIIGLKQIHLSGTPYNDILSARFSKEETFTFDFIDLIKLDKRTHEVGFPDLSILNVCNMTTLNELLVKARPDVFEKEEGFSLKKAFATEIRTRAILDLIFDDIFNPEDSDTFDGTEDNRLVFDGIKNKHILSFVPTIQAATWSEKYLKEKLVNSTNSILRKYKVLAVSGVTKTGNDIDTSAKKGGLEKTVNTFENNNEYTIVITCLKLTTGVTLRKTDSILLLRNCSSVETFIQILFRTMTPDPDKNKRESNLYCFDSNISLNVIKETLRIRQNHDDATDTDHIKELFGIINFKKFWANDGFEFDITSADEWLSAVKSIPVNLNLFKMWPITTLSSIVSNLTDEQKSALLNLDAIKSTNIKKEIARGVCDNINQRNYKSNSKERSYTKSDVEKLLACIETLFAHLDWAIVNYNIKNVEELYNNFHIELDNGTPNFVKN